MATTHRSGGARRTSKSALISGSRSDADGSGEPDDFRDGPFRADGTWGPEDGRDLFVHAHLSDVDGELESDGLVAPTTELLTFTENLVQKFRADRLADPVVDAAIARSRDRAIARVLGAHELPFEQDETEVYLFVDPQGLLRQRGDGADEVIAIEPYSADDRPQGFGLLPDGIVRY